MLGLNREEKEKVREVLQVKEGEEVLVIGCVVKEMQLKRGVFDDPSGRPIDPMANYCHSNDIFYLEDHSGRLQLHLQSHHLHTLTQGVILAAQGYFNKSHFIVQQLIHVHTPLHQIHSNNHTNITKNTNNNIDDLDIRKLNGPMVVLCSGLQFESESV